MSKQDRQGVRTPADLERKYDFGSKFSDADTSTAKFASQLNQLSATLSQLSAETNAYLALLEQGQTIVCTSSGKEITLTDSKSARLFGLKVYGRTLQTGEPSVDFPANLISAGESGALVITLSNGEESQKITVVTPPQGLCGIKVSTSGNYTDTQGDMWLCDEIDYTRGVYIQRIGYIENYQGQKVGDTYMSSTGALTAGASVVYPLLYPIESALSEEEMSDYANLKTYYPITALTISDDCEIEVTYCADIKAYIDKKSMG